MSPAAAPRPCLQPGCRALVHDGPRCAEHRRQREQERGNSHARGYDGRWRKFRLRYLREHPLCVHCERDGRVTPATDVDHVVPHRGDKTAFWRGPFQPLCHACHSAKTATEDGRVVG